MIIKQNELFDIPSNVEKEIIFTKEKMPLLSQFDKIYISCSGGKDSQAMAYLISNIAETQKYPKRNICLIYADTGLEWKDTYNHVEYIAQCLGVQAVKVKEDFTLLEKVKYKWDNFLKDKNQNPFPNVKQRYCTSDFKRNPIRKFLVKNHSKENKCKLLLCTGERWEESSARSKLSAWSFYIATSTKRKVYNWRPMLAYEKADIWSEIKNSNLEHHEAYKLGCDRLGCVVCIFHSICGHGLRDMQINCKHNQEKYEELDKLEQDTKFCMSSSRLFVRDLIKIKQ